MELLVSRTLKSLLKLQENSKKLAPFIHRIKKKHHIQKYSKRRLAQFHGHRPWGSDPYTSPWLQRQRKCRRIQLTPMVKPQLPNQLLLHIRKERATDFDGTYSYKRHRQGHWQLTSHTSAFLNLWPISKFEHTEYNKKETLGFVILQLTWKNRRVNLKCLLDQSICISIMLKVICRFFFYFTMFFTYTCSHLRETVKWRSCCFCFSGNLCRFQFSKRFDANFNCSRSQIKRHGGFPFQVHFRSSAFLCKQCMNFCEAKSNIFAKKVN